MRILFVLDRVENPASANAQLACRLAEQLLAQGHEIHLLELWDGENPPPAPPAGASQHTLAFADERLMNHALENGAKAGSPVPLRLLRLAAHPTAVAAAFRQLVLHAPRRTVDSRREMERLDAEFHFDAVCAVCAPYRTAFALETAQIGGKKLLWQLDPYASNKDYTAPGGYAREGQLLQTIDTAFITPQALPDYEGGPLSSWRGKVQVLGFPVLLPGGPVPAHEGVRCVFCGSLYPTLREPDFTLELFTALNAPDLTLTMAGRGWEPFEAAAQRAQGVLGARFVRPGLLPPEKAAELESGKAELNQKADELASGKTTLEAKAKELSDGKAQLAEKETELASGKKELEEKMTQLSAAKTELTEADGAEYCKRAAFRKRNGIEYCKGAAFRCTRGTGQQESRNRCRTHTV